MCTHNRCFRAKKEKCNFSSENYRFHSGKKTPYIARLCYRNVYVYLKIGPGCCLLLPYGYEAPDHHFKDILLKTAWPIKTEITCAAPICIGRWNKFCSRYLGHIAKLVAMHTHYKNIKIFLC